MQEDIAYCFQSSGVSKEKNESGATVLEYALLAALIAVVVAMAVTRLGKDARHATLNAACVACMTRTSGPSISWPILCPMWTKDEGKDVAWNRYCEGS